MATTPRHEFYETDERLTLSVFDKGANPDEVSIKFTPTSVTYEHGDKKLELDPLMGEIDPEASAYTVGKVKVEIRLAKKTQGRWVYLVRSPESEAKILPSTAAAGSTTANKRQHKNWEKVSDQILKADKEKTLTDDPNAVDSNKAFSELFQHLDEDAKRAMLKSYTESGGTTLSTDWEDVKKGTVPIRPPDGQEWKQWG
ncbi:hypothetical protein M422DRAFT_779162 [Sphaerobolus stellatus SS14]|uniref:SGS domain-containing protein n=1 Tax=Sphaerobolus stellatus (strain SS14) TaxID=990650 RepID=A0A0C9VDY2_SPHS4|nr:hypothetical protein M422DRAFT_779162 [Sphaerobolus stellatus SS14]